MATAWLIEHFETLDSTNTYLAQRAREGAPPGLVAYADFQQAGRGRRDRTWEAPPGSALLFSVLLPGETPESAHRHVISLALSVRDAIERLSGVTLSLKWPNDLLLEGIKCAGILADYVATPNGHAVVVGCGINLRSSPDGAAHLGEVVTPPSPRALLDAVLEGLDHRDEETLMAAYRAALGTLGQTVRVQQEHGDLRGVAVDVDDEGRLLVRGDDTTHVVSVGDVVHLRSES